MGIFTLGNTVIVLYVILGVVTLTLTQSAKIRTRIPVAEEQPEGTIVAHMSTIFNVLAISKIKHVRYKLLRGDASSAVVDAGTMETRNEKSKTEGPWVHLDENKGTLKLNRRIDRETDCVNNLIPCTIQLQVVLLPQEIFKIAELTLKITDINDNAPRFPSLGGTIEVSEDADIGHEINLDEFLATDADTGNNSVIRYSIPGSKTFGMKQFYDRAGMNHLRLVLRQKLDFATKPSHILKLTATDGGNPPLSNDFRLTIKVLDANDHSPIFDKKVYTIRSRENRPVGDVLTQVHASDEDERELGEITYRIVRPTTEDGNGDNLVSVNRQTGFIFLRKKLDRSKHDGLRIVVEARDGSNDNPRTGRTILLVRVDDVNDNAPEIAVNYIVDTNDGTAYVSESDHINTYLAHVSATDADKGRNGEIRMRIRSYALVTNERTKKIEEIESNCFILADGGLLATACTLDREVQDRYKVVVKACDKGSSPNCTVKVINVTVLDENEFSPVFEHPLQSVRLSENSDAGTHVATCLARDGDGDRASSAYSKNKFGRIVQSLNGQIFYRLRAMDDNGNFYREVDKQPFGFDPHTGKISLLRPLDYEKSKTWMLSVLAQDMGDVSSKSRTCNITVRIDDVNDNKPVFTSPTEVNSTAYLSVIGVKSNVVHFQAVDVDREMGSEIRYSLESVNKLVGESSYQKIDDDSLFSFNSSTGELKLMDKSTEKLGTYHITVRASDSGNISTSRSTGMYIVVTSMSDEAIAAMRDATPSSAAFTVALGLGVAAVFLLILAFIILAVLIRKRRRSAKRSSDEEKENKENRKNAKNKVEVPTSRSDVISPCPSSKSQRHSNSSTENGKKRHGSCGAASHEGCYVCDLSKSSPSLPEHSPFNVDNLIVGRKTSVQMTSSPSDHDSGRGSSDTKSDVVQEKPPIKDDGSDQNYCAYPLAYSYTKGDHTPSSTERKNPRTRLPQVKDQMGPTCSPACREIGHCDTCWMPKGFENDVLQVRSMGRHGSECSSDTLSSGSSFHRNAPIIKPSSSFSSSAAGRRRSGDYHKYEAGRYPSRSRGADNEPQGGARKRSLDVVEDDVFKAREKAPYVRFVDRERKGDYISVASSMNSGTSTETTFVEGPPIHSPPPVHHETVRRTPSLTRTAIV